MSHRVDDELHFRQPGSYKPDQQAGDGDQERDRGGRSHRYQETHHRRHPRAAQTGGLPRGHDEQVQLLRVRGGPGREGKVCAGG